MSSAGWAEANILYESSEVDESECTARSVAGVLHRLMSSIGLDGLYMLLNDLVSSMY